MAFPSQHNHLSRRVLTFGVVITLCLMGLSARLFYLQVSNYDKYQAKVIDQITLETNTTPNRGKIYDTNMNLLATNTTVYRVFISPYDIARSSSEVYMEMSDDEYAQVVASLSYEMAANENLRLIADKCAEVLGVDYNTVIEKGQKTTRRDETLQKNVSAEQAAVLRTFIQENGLTGMLNLSADTKRYYCYGDLASHVLGFTNSDGNGVYGVEATYNDYLCGVSGKYITARNALKEDMPFKYESYVGAENGANLVLTLDLRLQYELENQVKAAYQTGEAGNRVCGIAMNPDTGAILALAVYPNYDCNNPYELAAEFLTQLADSGLDEDSEDYAKLRSSLMYQMWNNKVVSETYEPGSTFKIITAAIGLEEGVVKVDDMFTCTGHYLGEGFSSPIACHRLEGHGTVTFARGLQQSCNPTIMQVVERIGRDVFYKYFEAFGYTSRTGVDLPAESWGVFHEVGTIHATELAVYSFGQTFKCTPLQQLTAICTVANGGHLVTPHILSEMVDDDGNVIYSYEPEEKIQIVSEETCKTLTDILTEGVATDGGAKNAYVKGYNVAAKTGTSQKQDKWVYEYDEEGNIIEGSGTRPYRVGSTVAYAPSDDPQIAVLIMVDEPMGGNCYGSVVAAPYISKFLSNALPYLGIEPKYTEEDLANQDFSIANLIGLDYQTCCLYLTNHKLKFVKVGNGYTVTNQVPGGGNRLLLDSGTVYLYTNEEDPVADTEVPDVINMNASNCNKAIAAAKLNIRIEGSTKEGAVVIAQSPAAGTLVTKGTIVTVELRHMDGTD